MMRALKQITLLAACVLTIALWLAMGSPGHAAHSYQQLDEIVIPGNFDSVGFRVVYGFVPIP